MTNTPTPLEPEHHTSWILVCIISLLVCGLIIALCGVAAFIAREDMLSQTQDATQLFTTSDTVSTPIFENTEIGADFLTQPPTVATVPEEETEEPTVSSDTINVDTWTRFHSKRLSLTFSYPSEWTIWEGSSPLSDGIQIADFASKAISDETMSIPGHKWEVTRTTLPEDETLLHWIKRMDKEYLGVSAHITYSTINNFPATIDTQVLDGVTGITVFVPLSDDTDRVLMFILSGPEETAEELSPLLNAFLSTIKISGS